jgi:hypothetical protein
MVVGTTTTEKGRAARKKSQVRGATTYEDWSWHY